MDNNEPAATEVAASSAVSNAPNSNPSNNLWSLTGRTIVVTGGTKGIGASVVQELLRLDAALVIYCSRGNNNGEETETTTTKNEKEETADRRSRTIHVPQCDLSTEQGRSLLLQVCQRNAPIHGVVNNVGMNVRQPIVEQSVLEYEQIFRTNVDAAYYFTRALYTSGSLLCHSSRRGGTTTASTSIVNVSSVAGIQSSGTGVAYAMTKAAINQWTKALACEWAGLGIRVNAVAPWMTWTPLLLAAANHNAVTEAAQRYTPMQRLAEPHEIAGPICFLLLDAASYMTGQVIAVDGGLTAQGFPGPCVDYYSSLCPENDSNSDPNQQQKTDIPPTKE
jgi:tropinone reductase I